MKITEINERIEEYGIKIDERFSNNIEEQTRQLYESGVQAFCYLTVYNNEESSNNSKMYFGFKKLYTVKGDKIEDNVVKYRGSSTQIKNIIKKHLKN